MRLFPILTLLLPLLTAAPLQADPWKLTGESDRREITPDLFYCKRTAVRAADATEASVHLAFFTSKDFQLEVVDLGTGPEPTFGALPDAFRSVGCVAGVNGGFFHPDYRPLGLVISEGKRVGSLETSKLLSGVIYSDDKGLHLVRKADFRDHPGITALLQSGPYLVEAGAGVRGLSVKDSRKRTFIATDWRGHWVLGATISPLTLAELGDCLGSSTALTGWKVNRALNLDGGSSTGFYFDRGAGYAPTTMTPWKRVRNLLGVVPRSPAPMTRR
jgi:hypothetical protein